MRKLGVLTAAAALAAVLGLGGTAWAVHGGSTSEYADSVVSFSTIGSIPPGPHSDETNVLGLPDGTGSAGWFNLGTGTGSSGEIIVEFVDNLLVDDTGDDLAVWEAHSFGPGTDTADISVSEDCSIFHFVGGATSDPSASGTTFANTFDINFGGLGISFVKCVKIENTGATSGGAQGFDLDSVEALNSGPAGFSLDVEKTLLDGPDELGTIGIGLEETQPFVFEIVIENTGGDEAADGAVVYDVLPAEYNLDPVAEEDFGTPSDACADTDGDCNGVASDDETRCVVTPTQPPGASKGKQPKKAPELLTIEILDLGAGETCTVTVWVTTDQNYGKHDPVIYEPTSCHYFFPGTGGDVPILDEFGVPMHDWIALNDGLKVFSPEDGALVEGPVGSIQLNPLCDFDDDGVVDELDECPLEGPPDLGIGETLGADGCIIPPA